MMAARVPAVGGTRTVPEPDPVARDYLLLALRLDQHAPGLVDGYFGPASLKAQVDMEPRRPPERLRDDAAALNARLDAEVDRPDRRAWLRAQLAALETQAAALAGDELPYVEHVTRCFGIPPRWTDDAELERAAARLDALLPGEGDVAGRLEEWDASVELEPDRVTPVVEWLIERFRDRAAAGFGIPAGERVSFSVVRNQPWGAYTWYDGGLRSRFDLNVDLPIRASVLPHIVGHETFPGHHLEHAWKEADLVERAGRLEASVLLINTPECLISEGLPDPGFDLMLPHAEREALFEALFERAALPLAADPVRARETAERAVSVAGPRATLGGAALNAALMLHAEGRPRADVLSYLVEVGRFAPARAEKRLEFLSHPLWRTYIPVYTEGDALLRRWLDLVPEEDRPGRYARLLHEQLTPGGILAEVEAGIVA